MAKGEIIEILRRIDLPSLRNFAGETVLRAVQLVTPSNYEGQICEILLLKFGDDILCEKPIRFAIIDGIRESDAIDFCKKLGLKAETPGHAFAALQKYFNTWNEKRSSQFVELFDLSENFVFRKSIDSRPSREVISASFGESIKLRGVLHGYQKRIKDDIALRRSEPGLRFLVQMPTGAGKTYTALEAAVDVFRLPRNERFVVWLVNSNELAEQAYDAFSYLWRVKGDRPLTFFRQFKDFASDYVQEKGGIVFASFNSIHNALKDETHSNHGAVRHLVKNTQLLIVDEAHTSVAPTYEPTIRAFINTDICTVIGLSATPGRSSADESIDLTRLYSTALINITDENFKPVSDPIRYLQDGGYLAKLSVEILETNAKAEGDESAICQSLAQNSERNQRIIEQIKLAEEAKQSTLVFACTLDHVFALKVLCGACEIRCQVITGATPQSARLSILESFRNRDYFVLINLDLLSTGIDLPNVEKIIITRPVGSPILYSQILGRALRGPLNGGRECNAVVTLYDNLANFPSENLVYSYFSDEWNNPTPLEE